MGCTEFRWWMKGINTTLKSPLGRRVNPIVAVGMKIGALAGRSEGDYRLFAQESLQRRLAGWQSDAAQQDAVICIDPLKT